MIVTFASHRPAPPERSPSNYRRSMIVTFAITPAPAPPERSPSNYRRSMIVTFAWPPPSHMVCRP